MTDKEIFKELQKVHYNNRQKVHKLLMKWVKNNGTYNEGDIITDGKKIISIRVVSYTFSNTPGDSTYQVIYLGDLLKKNGKPDSKIIDLGFRQGQILQKHAKRFKPKKKKKK